MKPKDPIALSSLVEYYIEEPTLRRNKSELIAEVKDLITITDFLSARIPTIMKSIKENVRVQQKIIKDASTSLKSELRAVTEDPKYECSYYLKSAYDLFCSFSFCKESDKDYIEKTIAEKDMKLKYLESANLVNYMWHKPSKGNYAWLNHFNPKTSMIEVVSRKFTVYVGMAVAQNNYVWDIKEVRLKVTGDHEQWLKDYYEEKVKPALINMYPGEHEEYVLFGIDHFSKCFELLELHLSICEICQEIPFTKEIKYVYKGIEYEFTFTKVEEFNFPEIVINVPNYSFIKIKLQFNKDSVKGLLEIYDENSNLLFVFQTENGFKYEDTESLFHIFEMLTEFAERFKKFEVLLRNSSLSIEDMKEHMFIKINGCIWKQCKIGNNLEVLEGKINGNGLYLGGCYHNYSTFVEITREGKLFSKYLSKPILTTLVQKVPCLKVLFYFCIMIEQILPSNRTRDCEIEFCKLHEEQNSLVLFMQKRLWLEEQMIKLISKEEENIFNYSKFLLLIPFSFKNVNFYVIREKEQKHSILFDNWDKKLKEYDENDMMKLDVVINIVKEVQDNVMLKYIYDKRMMNNNKPTIGLAI